jgi:hypothetical protein
MNHSLCDTQGDPTVTLADLLVRIQAALCAGRGYTLTPHEARSLISHLVECDILINNYTTYLREHERLLSDIESRANSQAEAINQWPAVALRPSTFDSE